MKVSVCPAGLGFGRGRFWASPSLSLLPLATAWMAVSELAPQPVAFYAAVFFLVNATYVFVIWELIEPRPLAALSRTVRGRRGE